MNVQKQTKKSSKQGGVEGVGSEEVKSLSNATYRKAVRLTLADPKLTKLGLRTMMRKRKNVILSHALAGIGTEIGEVIESMSPFLAGHQLNDEMKNKFADESGDLLYYTHLGATQVGAKMPASTKKIRSKETPQQLLMDLNRIGVQLSSAHKKLYYGSTLDVEKIKTNIEALATTLIALSWAVLDKPVADLMRQNTEKLAKRYPEGKFDLEALNKSKEATAQA